MITYKEIKANEAIKAYIKKADESLNALGFTEHSFAHVGLVANRAEYILTTLGYDEHTVELVKIAAHLHDIGNIVNRREHSQSGAVMAFRILDKLDMTPDDIATVVTAIGNHDEGEGEAVNEVAAALILADKSDVRRTRVRNTDMTKFDIHDRVNYAAKSSKLSIDREAKEIRLDIELDDEICSLMDYFEIFLDRMIMCRRAAEMLDCQFKMQANGSKIL